MALTRKMLQAMDIPAEKIDEIITAHTETLGAIKDERDQYKKELESLKDSDAELKTVKDELEKIKTGDWEKKYNDLKSEYDSYKSDTEAKEVRAKKDSAYRKLLIKAGVSEKRIDSIIKVSDVDKMELDADGNIKDADNIEENVKKEWADFIAITHEKGADVSRPPQNDGGSDAKKPSRASELVAQYRNEHYGNPLKKED